MLISRLAVANQGTYKNTRKHFHDTENLEILKLEILLAHDQSELAEALILMNFVRWREFHCFAALYECIRVTRKVVIPKSNTGRGQKSRRRPPDPMILLACSRSDCSSMKP